MTAYKLHGQIAIHQATETVISPHRHPFLEFVYISEGTAVHRLGGTGGTLSAGDYFIVDYDTAHSYRSTDQEWCVLNCLFLPEFIHPSFLGIGTFNELARRYFFRITGRTVSAPPSDRVFHDRDGSIRQILLKMQEEYTLRQEGYLEILRASLCELIIRTVRNVGSSQKRNPLTEELLAEIHHRYREKLTLKELCSARHYSLSYVSSLFKEDTGYSFTDCLQQQRISESCRLLKETDLPISRIAEQVGYSDTKFFNRIFKEIAHMTPREYRKMQ